MVAALIISICVAIIFLGLFISERSSSEEFRKEISGQKRALDRLRDELVAGKGNDVSGHMETADGQEARKLTGELVSEALKQAADRSGPSVFIGRYGKSSDIRRILETHPQLQAKADRGTFFYRPWGSYEELVKRVDSRSITDDGETLRFQADAYEPSYGHFRDSIGCYLGVIHETQKRLHDVYDEMVRQKESQKELASYGFRSDESLTGENKVLS